MTRQSANSRHWWLLDEQTCEFCHSGYAVQLEVRCVECDRPVCPLCVVHVRAQRRAICPECDADGDE